MRKVQMTCPSIQACGWPSQDKTQPCPNPFDTLLIGWELENTENWWDFPGPGSYFLYSPLPKPCMSPQITGEGGSGIIPDTQYMVFPPTIQTSSQGTDHCQLTSDTISVELVTMPQVEIPRLPWLQMQPCGLALSCSDQETESWTFHDPNSMPKNSIEPATKLRKPLTHCPHFKVQDKIRNSEMEEIFRAQEEWRWAGLPCPPEQNTLTSGPFALPSLFMDFYWGFTQ